MTSIAPLGASCRHSLASGVVIQDTAGIVKELVENALDAHATNIEIRLVNYGGESIEVDDNGDGIEEANLAHVGRAHSTSKLTSVDDLHNNIHTFGFRGEAFNAICSLADVQLFTRHSSSPAGTRHSFDHSGAITSATKVSRGNTGTTVTVTSPFITRPVRRKHLLSNLRASYTKVLRMVETYALLAHHSKVRIMCSHRVGKQSPRTTLLLVDGRTLSWRACFDEIFTSNTKSPMVAIEQTAVTSEHREMYGIGVDEEVINDEFTVYNHLQKPIFAIYVTVPTGSLDVNRVPDKREVFITCETIMLAVIRSSVKNALNKVAGLCPTVTAPLKSLNESITSAITVGYSVCPPKTAVTKNTRPITEQSTANQPITIEEPTSGPISSRQTPTTRPIGMTRPAGFRPISVDRPPHAKQRKLHTFGFESMLDGPTTPSNTSMSTTVQSPALQSTPNTTSQRHHDAPVRPPLRPIDEPAWRPNVTSQSLNTDILPSRQAEQAVTTPMEDVVEFTEETSSYEALSSQPPPSRTTLSLSMDNICESMKRVSEWSTLDDQLKGRTKETDLQPVVKDVDDMLAPGAEENLTTILHKEQFGKMKVIGQFNKGFIIAQLSDNIFIIDQHASDEKYMFEMYMKHGDVQSQTMLCPVPCGLSRAGESVLRENESIFRKCGFHFDMTDNNVRMTAAPSVNGHTFNLDDVEQMISALTEAPGIMYRPPRLRKVFASKACRKSVMIGTELDVKQMNKIIGHLSSLSNPWNCPHGRPTLRHLSTVEQLAK